MLEALGVVWRASSTTLVMTPLGALLICDDGSASDVVASSEPSSAQAILDEAAPKSIDATQLSTTTTTTTSTTTTTTTTNAGSNAMRVSELNATSGHIIVETNFRIYAYTSSPLDIAILSIFATPAVRLPNLCVAAITRDSIVRL